MTVVAGSRVALTGEVVVLGEKDMGGGEGRGGCGKWERS